MLSLELFGEVIVALDEVELRMRKKELLAA